MNETRNRVKQGGFTMIELVVVVGVIGILVAILFPAVNAGRVKAKEREAAVIAESLANAVTAYHTENGKWPIDDDNFQNFGGKLTADQHKQLIAKLSAPRAGGSPFW